MGRRVTQGAFAAACGLFAMASANGQSQPAPSDKLRAGFEDPPHEARPQVWWHWMSGNVTQEGALLDLQWLHDVGIGGVHAFAGGRLEPTVVDHPAPFMSVTWRTAFRAAVDKAHADGMDVTIAGSPGWSETGGPWVQPADGMKKYVWATKIVEGGHRIKTDLPSLPTATGPFASVPRDPGFSLPGDPKTPDPIASGPGPVIAFPLPAEEAAAPSYTSSAGSAEALATAAADLSSDFALPMSTDGSAYVDVRYAKPVEMQALTLAMSTRPAIDILVSRDGKTFDLVRHVPQDEAEHPSRQQTFAFKPATGLVFRIRFGAPKPWRVLPGLPRGLVPPPGPVIFHLQRVTYSAAPRIDGFEAKAGFQSIVDQATLEPAAKSAGLSPTSVIDLERYVTGEGALDWTPPPGRWMILRFGWSLTGQTNGPAEPVATGLEVDKLDAKAVDRYVDGLFSLYSDRIGVNLGPAAVNGLLTDSWEAGVQNWTPALLQEFRKRRGYDPLPWLPALAGYVVGSSERSDAFLADFRQTLKDLLISSHYDVLADAAHKRGMTYYTEVQGDTPRAIVDAMTAKSRSDIPTGEFWYRPFATVAGQPSLVADLQEAASAAHVYGKPLVAAEALTVAAGNDPWAFSPAMMKPVADQIFARGVNRILLHESHLQPFPDRKPGLALGFFGQYFNRNETWAGMARPFVDYLARTSHLLQQGRFVADVAYFYGEEDGPTRQFELAPNKDVPPGYAFDYINPEALLDKLSVRDGKIVTQTGMQYQVLYIPQTVHRLSLPVVEKLGALVRAGATLVAMRPKGGIGLNDEGAAYWKAVDLLWGHDGEVRQLGQGMVYAQSSLADVLRTRRIAPDVDDNGAQLLFLHRRASDSDIYFLSNQSSADINPQVAFRVDGRIPQWWSPEDGKARDLSFRRSGGRTVVDLKLDPQQAGFVVFKGRTDKLSRTVAGPRVAATMTLDRGWSIRFENGWGGPPGRQSFKLGDWSKSTEPSIRYFSGVAAYDTMIDVPGKMIGTGRHMVLDLGNVRDLAQVEINGRAVSISWHAPYRVDVTGFLKAGSNRIVVRVANLWVNRLIGDKQPGAKPFAYAPASTYRADSKLLPSGLIGPVRLTAMDPAD